MAFTREPENLEELHLVIIEKLAKSEKVVITLTDGDGLHELLASIQDGIDSNKKRLSKI